MMVSLELPKDRQNISKNRGLKRVYSSSNCEFKKFDKLIWLINNSTRNNTSLTKDRVLNIDNRRIKRIINTFFGAKVNFELDAHELVSTGQMAPKEVVSIINDNEKGAKNRYYIWLKNEENLNKLEKLKLENISKLNLKTARAYRLKLSLQDLYNLSTNKTDAAIRLQAWYSWAIRSKIEPIISLARTIKNNWSGILNYFDSNLTNYS